MRDVFSGLKDDFEKYYSTGQNGVMLQETSADLEVVYKGIPYKITSSNIRSTKNQEREVLVFDKVSNDYVKQDEAILGAFDISIYSQKQVYEMSKDENALREIIDGFNREIECFNDDINNSREEYLCYFYVSYSFTFCLKKD